jgi:DNA-binding NarL/FixJ family response regulator
MLFLSIPKDVHGFDPAALASYASPAGLASPLLSQRFGSLTPRQRQVLDFLKVGLTNAAIARRMGITIHTVKAHRMSVMSRMHANTFANLISMVEHLPVVRKVPRNAQGKLPSVTVVGFLVQRRRSMVRTLNAHHFAATGVATGEQLDTAWALDPADIAIVEPELEADHEDGWHIAQRILKRRTIGVILLSTHRKSFDRIKGLQMGADACFKSPVNMDELRAVLTNLGRRLHHV